MNQYLKSLKKFYFVKRKFEWDEGVSRYKIFKSFKINKNDSFLGEIGEFMLQNCKRDISKYHINPILKKLQKINKITEMNFKNNPIQTNKMIT